MKKIVKTTAVALSVTLIAGISASKAYSAEQSDTVRLGGQPFGVRFYNDGVVVTELEDFFDGCRYLCPARSGGLKTGDVIKAAGDRQVKTNEDLQSITADSSGKPICFTVERNGKRLERSVTPQKNISGQYLLGAWVRDSCAGIGTVTYYDDDRNYFAALGHGICDADTGALMPLGSAEIVRASINSVTKSAAGKPGSLNGYFTGESIGELTDNTSLGVYGKAQGDALDEGRSVEIADFDEIKTGKAEIFTTITEGEPEYYTIEITDICNSSPESNENFVIKITDKRLLDECGGIVQGMSGSPIIQNGKLVGAVTHVFLNSPKEGYGVSARYMVSNRNE